jgi:D-lactate dehydrogenase
VSRTEAGSPASHLPGLADPARRALERAVPGVLGLRAIDRLSKAHDASHYLLVPDAVATPRSTDEVAALMRACASVGLPLTFRSGGTSLSGQAGTEHLLVDTRRHFREITVLDGGARVRVEPGATVRQVNARLSPYGTKLGPDPASEGSCTLGGVIANNSSGMACGTELNTYQTLESAELVLPSGTVIDTADSVADARLADLEPQIHAGLRRLTARVRSNAESVSTITRQFQLKNTMGYGLNAFLDFERPIDVLLRLVIGSEGTLAFVGRATFRTVPLRPHSATGLLVFDNLERATQSLPDLVAADLATIELMDATSLRVGQRDAHADPGLRDLAVEQHAALLVEYQEASTSALEARVAAGTKVLGGLPLTAPASLSTDPARRASMWHVRKGLYATVAGNRPSGTTALLEDVAVPVKDLAVVCQHLIGLFREHRYRDSVIFGHAKDGNIHFLLNERFDDGQDLGRYLSFTEDMVDLVLGHHGTLKAEHGTGRIMAPFVRRQYGDELYAVMVELKRLVDPASIMNPGVIISDDPHAHVRHLKTSPEIEPEADRCVECGFCEPVCPSQDLTLTPRSRIVLRREMAKARLAGNDALADEIARDYAYDGIDTCAADGMCQTACPVLIDTGSLVKRLRAERHQPAAERAWRSAARHWGSTTRIGSAALTMAHRLPDSVVGRPVAALRSALGDDNFPAWTPELPAGGPRRAELRPTKQPDAVFFPSCVGSIFGPAGDGHGAAAAFVALCQRAGLELTTPRGINALCCGTPWKSKGLPSGHEVMREKALPEVWRVSLGGTIPVVCEASSCSEGLMEMLSLQPGLQVVDAVSFVCDRVLPSLPPPSKLDTVVVHPTCSSTRLGTNDALLALASSIAERAVVPTDWGCCAFAGDRGLLHPELTAAATERETRGVTSDEYSAYLSCNRTCELGMTRATGRTYRHVLELLEELTRPTNKENDR